MRHLFLAAGLALALIGVAARAGDVPITPIRVPFTLQAGLPTARALIGKHEGDSFEFTAPNGVKHYEITGVRYE